ncbi:polysaccharide pyruvyl transferase family protein [Rhodobaculum claviforme]|uniref:polysaccharide pyruvyl transferase family protein n=1 Tax=Rhodobaculum claviforme TaxID=1549854 RepID=UPI001911E987
MLFLRPYHAHNFLSLVRPLFLPTVPANPADLPGLQAVHASSGHNVGNFIHTEAMPTILRFDPGGSATLSLSRTVRLRNMRWLVDVTNAEFDMVVFSAANFVRPETDFTHEAKFFEGLKIPAVLVGAGIQEVPETGTLALKPSLQRFLEIANANFSIFGTRGTRTAEVLHDMGLTRAEPLGCPSFYAFPRKMLSVVPPDLEAPASVLTAGHASRRGGPGARYETLSHLLRPFAGRARIDYVIQNEMFFGKETEAADGFYDPVTKELAPDWVRARFFSAAGPDTVVPRMHFFTDTSSWRMFAAQHDFYVGDRIHGAVIALQAGRPAVVVHNDTRVHELAECIGLPGIALRDVTRDGAAALLAEALGVDSLARFRRRYAGALAGFRQRLTEAGLLLEQSGVAVPPDGPAIGARAAAERSLGVQAANGS